jgi:chemotaxis protein CheD
LKHYQSIAEEKKLCPLTAGYGLQKADFTQSKRVFACERLNLTCVIQADLSPKVEEVQVDMADMKVECKTVELLTSVGSYVAICMHDLVHKCGGLAHIMLPKSTYPQEPLPPKYVITTVPVIIKEIQSITEKENHLSAKIAGDANMFANLSTNSLGIVAKKVKAVREALEKQLIRLVGEEVSRLNVRRITFNVASVLATVRPHNGETKNL